VVKVEDLVLLVGELVLMPMVIHQKILVMKVKVDWVLLGMDMVLAEAVAGVVILKNEILGVETLEEELGLIRLTLPQKEHQEQVQAVVEEIQHIHLELKAVQE
jgi:hypothetical protein